MKKTFIIPLIATGTFILGMACLFLPFLPFGWLLLFMTALLLTPYFKPVEKLLKWLIQKDKTGTFNKARAKVARLYQWAGDTERAHQMENFHQEFSNKSPETDVSEKSHSAPNKEEAVAERDSTKQ